MKKALQLDEALEMLKSFYLEQQYVSKIHNCECEFRKKMGFYSTTDVALYLL